QGGRYPSGVARAPLADLRVGGGLDRLETRDAVRLALANLALGAQQVEMPEHLRQRQERLCDGDVAPHPLRQLVGGQRSLRQEAVDLALAPLGQREALVDQR